MLTQRHTSIRDRSRGFTMIEILVTTAALGIVAAAIYGIFGTSMRLYTNGVSASRTGFAIREVYDRIAFDIQQSPGRYASAMTLDTSTSPARLNETMGVASSALGLCKVVAGPLQVSASTTSSGKYTGATLIKPAPTADTTNELVADHSTFSIKPGDYIKLIIGDAIETRILTASKSGTTWTVTFDPYEVTYASNPDTSPITDVPVYVLRYSAYVVLKDLNVYNRNRDCLALYEGLEVVARRGSIPYNPPSTLKLPANYLTSYSELVSTDVGQSTLSGAGTGWQPFRYNYNTDQPTVIINLGVKATEYDQTLNNPDFYKTANLDTSVYLKSNDL